MIRMSARHEGSGWGDVAGPAISFALILGTFWALRPKEPKAPPPLPPSPAPPPLAMRHASGGTSAGWSVGQVAYCFDAVKNMQVCASVADVLANGNDIGRLRAFSSK